MASAEAVDANGDVIAGFTRTAGGQHATWVWEDGVYDQLPFVGVPHAVSGNGYRVVGTTGTEGDAYYWTRDTGYGDLQILLETEYGFDFGDSDLWVAEDLSDDGLTMVGRRLEDGVRKTFLLRIDETIEVAVPEPGLAIGLLVGGCLLSTFRRPGRASV